MEWAIIVILGAASFVFLQLRSTDSVLLGHNAACYQISRLGFVRRSGNYSVWIDSCRDYAIFRNGNCDNYYLNAIVNTPIDKFLYYLKKCKYFALLNFANNNLQIYSFIKKFILVDSFI